MRKTDLYKKLYFIFFLLVFLGLGIKNQINDNNSTKKIIRLVHAEWLENEAITTLVSLLLEKQGYQVEITFANMALFLYSLALKQCDVFVGLWLPNTHGVYWDKFHESLEDIGIFCKGARVGLNVPENSSLKSILDLKRKQKNTKEVIITSSIDSGAYQRTIAAIKAYEIDITVLPTNSAIKDSMLIAAIKKNESIIVAGWTPNWIFSQYSIRFLDDPLGVFGQEESAHIVTKKGFEYEFPEAAHFLRNFQISLEEIADLTHYVLNRKGKIKLLVKNWLLENPQILQKNIKLL